MSYNNIVLNIIPTVECPKYVGRGRKVRCWLGGQLLFFWIGFSFVLKPQLWERNGGQGCRVSLWGHDSRSSALLASFRHFSPRRVNTRIPYSWNVPLVPDDESVLHCHGVSDKVLCFRNPKQYSIPYRIFLSSILYHIEYSSDHTRPICRKFHICRILQS